MKIVYSNVIPIKGFAATNLFGVLFVRKSHRSLFENYPDNPRVKKYLHHEYMHTVQMKYLLYVFFYLIYGVEWVVKIFTEGKAYRNIGFEREAYKHEKEYGTLSFTNGNVSLGNSYASTMNPYHWTWFMFHRQEKP